MTNSELVVINGLRNTQSQARGHTTSTLSLRAGSKHLGKVFPNSSRCSACSWFIESLEARGGSPGWPQTPHVEHVLWIKRHFLEQRTCLDISEHTGDRVLRADFCCGSSHPTSDKAEICPELVISELRNHNYSECHDLTTLLALLYCNIISIWSSSHRHNAKCLHRELGNIPESESSSNSYFVHRETETDSKVTFPELQRESALSETYKIPVESLWLLLHLLSILTNSSTWGWKCPFLLNESHKLSQSQKICDSLCRAP